jgi:hypothetical protein
MKSRDQASIYYHWGVITLFFFLFLAALLVVIFPKLSQSADIQLNDYHIGISEGGVTNLQTENKQLVDYHMVVARNDLARKMIDNAASSVNSREDTFYQILIGVIENQKILESINKELAHQLALKNDRIKSLQYNEEVLWEQLDESENKYWHAIAARDEESQIAQDLTDKLALKEDIIRALEERTHDLRVQLEFNIRKYKEVLAARDAEYKRAVERISLKPETVFSYSPPRD